MTARADQSIVLTGCGWVTPFANGSTLDVLTAGVDARPAPTTGLNYWAVPDTLRDECVSAGRLAAGLSNELKRDKAGWMTALALEHACREASLTPADLPPERVGLVVGSELAGQLGMIEFAGEVRTQGPRFVSPIHFPQTVGNYLAGALARAYGFRGASLTLSSGAASGLDAIVEACGLLRSDAVDLVFAGGTDRLSEPLAQGFGTPDEVPSEGACLFVLERADHAAARAANPRATVLHSASCTLKEWEALADPAAVLSTAACRRPGGMFIEHWVGRCFGVAGAAAVAAALGAARGCEVPIVEEAQPLALEVRRLTDEPTQKSSQTTYAIIAAAADPSGANLTTLELQVHANDRGPV